MLVLNFVVIILSSSRLVQDGLLDETNLLRAIKLERTLKGLLVAVLVDELDVEGSTVGIIAATAFRHRQILLDEVTDIHCLLDALEKETIVW